MGYAVGWLTQKLGLLFAEGGILYGGSMESWWLRARSFRVKGLRPTLHFGPNTSSKTGGLDVRLHLSRTHSGKSAGHAKPLITYRVFILHI